MFSRWSYVSSRWDKPIYTSGHRMEISAGVADVLLAICSRERVGRLLVI